MPDVKSDSATIAAGQSVSDSVDLHGLVPVTVVLPAAWTAADITFQQSVDGNNWTDMYDEGGSERTAVVSTSRAVFVDPVWFLGAKYVRFRSGPAAAPVNQAAERVIGVRLRDF